MEELDSATLGGGCFWCLEAVYTRLEGVKSVVSGYAGGNVENPTYEQVCTGETSHAEVIKIDYDPNRTRKLLLKKKEIAYLRAKSQEKGLTIVPLSVYNRGRHIKVKIGVAKGKKKHDKRDQIKRRDIKRQIQRVLKEQK